MDYIVAALYQGINKRVKNDTPYFNTLMLLLIAIYIHFIQLILIVKKVFRFNVFKALNKSVYISLFIIFFILGVLLLRRIFPKKIIFEIQVREIDVKNYYNFFIIYFVISVIIMGVLF